MDCATEGRDHVLARFVREHLEGGVVVLDPSCDLVYVNQAARSGACDVAALFAKPIADRCVARMLGQLREQGAASAEIACPARDGTGKRHVRLQAAAVCGLFVVAVQDRSEQQALSEEVRQLRGLASLGLLTASVAHDLNNLLTPIYALGSFLAGKLEREEPRALSGEIVTAAERAVRLVRTVLTASRPKSPDMEIIDVNVAVSEMKPLIARLLGPTVELTLLLDNAPTPAVFERARFEHALLNLAANARDAMPGSGRLTITTANVALGNGAAATSGEHSYVMISVTDTGAGMCEQTCARIFDPFFTTKDGDRGVGLGLTSVRNFATDIGGFVSAHSAPGEGTTISIYLPGAAHDAPRKPPRAQAENAAAGRGETVLVVDADPAVCRATALILQAHGYRTLWADSEAAALRAASSAEPPIDALLLDADISPAAPQALRERLAAATGGSALVVMSAAAAHSPQPAGESEAEGPVLLRKAFSSDELLAAVRAALDRRGPGR